MDRKPVDLRHYLRRPDRDFWLEMFRPAPSSSAAAMRRRQRLTRFTLGAATLISTFYAMATLMWGLHDTWPIFLTNMACALCFGMGMWMASLNQHAIARWLLIVPLNLQVFTLIILTGQTLNIVVYCLALAVLARALFTQDESKLRWLFILLPTLSLVAGMTLFIEPNLDMSAFPPLTIAMLRVFNAVLTLACVVVLLGTFDNEVLRSEHDLIDARDRSDKLLHAVLPQKIATQLRNSPAMIANRHPEVTVLFADIAGFTPWSSKQTPETVVAMLEKVFSRFDARVTAAGAEKIKTIGDAYMVISGAPDPRDDHAQVIARLALELLDEVRRVREETSIDINLRVGIHTGEVIAGVIGAMRFSYDVWGDTVNTASRMESHGEPGRIQISGDTYAHLGKAFHCEKRGVVNVKGKGEMETWWLTGLTQA